MTKTRLVKPTDFVITERATNFHQITQEHASQKGHFLPDVLREFMDDVREAFRKGGRVVAHHIEFDYRIIYEELGRSGLSELQQEWKSIAGKGCCTMDPIVGRWLRQCMGKDVGPETATHTVPLDEMFGGLHPENTTLLKKRHDAGADAEMAWLVYAALLLRARAGRARAM